MVLNSARKWLSARILVTSTMLALIACGSVGGDEGTNEYDPNQNDEEVGSVTFGVMKPGGTNGDGNYCDNPSALCNLGEGDCDRATQCSAGLTCITDNGAKWGFAYGLEVCAPAHCGNKVLDGNETAVDCGGSCSSPSVNCGTYCANTYWATYPTGNGNHCSAECRCPAGQGDCDSDAQCTTGNVCIAKNGFKFGFPNQDFCAPATCRNGVQDAGETFPDCGGPCSSPGYDCTQVCPTHWAQYPNGNANHCTNLCPCPGGQGDCDSDAQCTTGNVCINNNGYKFGFPGQDFCAPATCRNGIQDAGEAGIDCGGSCSSLTCAQVCAAYQTTTAPNGNNNHCTNQCQCPAGQGDCDSDAQCTTGNVCINNNGYKFGFPGQDFCGPATCRNGIQDAGEAGIDCGGSCSSLTCAQLCVSYQTTYPNGNTIHCTNACPCASGHGDCDSDAQCQTGLVCINNNGEKFGFPGQDVCAPATCRNGVLDAGEAGVDCGGPCSTLTCAQYCASYQTTTYPNGNNNHCSATCPCASGEGDCDGNTQCQAGLVCGSNNSIKFGFAPGQDHCVPASCVNRILDAGETSVDCGGACGSCGQFAGIGDLAGGATESYAYGVSADGNVVVGNSNSANGDEAFRWTVTGGMVGLGDLAGGSFSSVANGVSDNGAVIVGRGANASSATMAFKWTAATGMVSIGELAGGQVRSEAYGVSRNGLVTVGPSSSTNGFEAFIHSGSTMTGLGDLPGGIFRSEAWATNGDGTVVVGRGWVTTTGYEAFRWTQAGGMVSLGDLPGGAVASLATAVAGAGSVIAGDATTAAGIEAFRWTSAGMVGIGVPAGMAHSYAYGISSKGDRIIGTATDASFSNNIAFLWIQGVGIQSLQDIITSQGGNTTGWTLRGATAISGDGKVIVGFGVNPSGNTEAFRAVIP